MMNFQTLLIMSILYGITIFFWGHQGSHLAWIKAREASLNILLVLILYIYHITFLPWLALIYIGYKTLWYYPVIILALAQVIRLFLVSIEMRFKWNGALISLTGILVIPISLIALILQLPNFM